MTQEIVINSMLLGGGITIVGALGLVLIWQIYTTWRDNIIADAIRKASYKLDFQYEIEMGVLRCKDVKNALHKFMEENYNIKRKKMKEVKK